MRDLITGAPGPDLERRIDDLERMVRDLRSELVSVRDRLERLEETGGSYLDASRSGEGMAMNWLLGGSRRSVSPSV